MNKKIKEPQLYQQNDPSMYGPEATTNNNKDYSAVNELQHEQMLKLIAKGFYKELISYGIDEKDVIIVSTHLLDNLMEANNTLKEDNRNYSQFFILKNIKDEWDDCKRLTIDDVSISLLKPDMYAQVALWLEDPTIKYSFISLFPDTENAQKDYFEQSDRNYFSIFCENKPVGIIGADYIDNGSSKLEMRKFVGNTDMQGKGIGKRATLLFLYYSFIILKFNKVYIHSVNTNIRNINLNSKFGFELEGVFFEDAFLGNKKRDIVRMGLLRSVWMDIFSGT